MKTKLLGYEIDNIDFCTAINYAQSCIKSKRPVQVVTINPEMFEIAQKNEQFSDVLRESELVLADGIGIKIGLKIKGIEQQRITGIEYAKTLLELCCKEGYTVGFLGAKEENLQKMLKKFKQEMPDLKIVFAQNGYFKDDLEVMQEIIKNKPQVLLCALGAPKQELFIYNLKKYLNSFMIGVGGSFDVWSGVVKRAPVMWQKLGLEWLYRTLKEPKRLKRIFPTLPAFIFKVIISKDE